jgi:hypothetical protein
MRRFVPAVGFILVAIAIALLMDGHRNAACPSAGVVDRLFVCGD